MTTKATQDWERPQAWRIRASLKGEDEDATLACGRTIIGFREVPDLSGATDSKGIESLVRGTVRDESVTHTTTQLNHFARRISIGDIVLTPLKTRPGLAAVGEVTGPYEYHQIDGRWRHTRRVKWLRRDVPHEELGAELKPYLDLRGTLTRMAREAARLRLIEVARGHPATGSDSSSDLSPAPTPAIGDGDAEPAALDLSVTAETEIREHVRASFPGHRFAGLVDAILRADGYVTSLSAPGPDGGVDIIAGRGPLGFDAPRLCVQVKATLGTADVKVVRELQGAMQDFGADRGLFVSWSGFTGPARAEARKRFFTMRLWTANDVINALCTVYDTLNEDVQAEIPLKQIWTLVRDDEA